MSPSFPLGSTSDRRTAARFSSCWVRRISRVRRSRVPGECSERPCASATRPGTRRKNREARSTRVALGPGSRCARPGHDGPVRRRMSSSHDVKQRSVIRSRGALLRPGSRFSFRVHPSKGWAERRQAHSSLLCRACEARRPRERNAGRPVATGTPSRRSTVAIFGRGPVLPPPAVAPEPTSDLPAPGRKDLAGGIPDLPRCGSRRNRETPLPAPPSGSFLENAPSERGWESL
jgi:hypothetical protein